MNITINQETAMSPSALFYKEKEYLHPLPSDDIIDAYLTTNKYKVSSEGLIRYGNTPLIKSLSVKKLQLMSSMTGSIFIIQENL